VGVIKRGAAHFQRLFGGKSDSKRVPLPCENGAQTEPGFLKDGKSRWKITVRKLMKSTIKSESLSD
jgi:hypothetical protein